MINGVKDFSLVTSPEFEESLEGIQASINSFKKKYEQILEVQKELNDNREDAREMTVKYKQRIEKLKDDIIKDQQTHTKSLANEKKKLAKHEQEERELEEEIERVKVAVKEEKDKLLHLKQEADVFAAVPERKVIFKGEAAKATNSQDFQMEAHIVYPMNGGTALVTFEEEVVAKKILVTKKHQVDLGGDCSICVEARLVQLIVPSLVEIDTQVCPHRILISNLPKMDTDTLLNKLEIHFSKSKNGGGEVDECEMLTDSGTVVLTFVENNIASGLTDIEQHEVKLQQKKHKVRVTPFINGKITDFKSKMSVCPRTVLLTGIPVVMEQDTLQDLLEIHFQKSSNGGGEIEALLYNPMGEQTLAQFETVPPNSEEE
ncbi:interferon-induced protein 35 [Scomber japonicus]|uniref:interferon-induced protein 35 n=1 Tax=Scomber japonicus TaxID=13676 RepID=UPI002304F711|nr:interferon-induced protein 35 [Scomber japonicus]